MEKKEIAVIVAIAVVAVIAIAAVVVVSDDDSDEKDGVLQSFNLGNKEFVKDRIACDQTSLVFGDGGAVTYTVWSKDSGWSYNGVTMYDVHIEAEVATHHTTRDFTLSGTFSGSASLVEDPTTNYSELVYAQSKGTGFGEQWFSYSYGINSVYTYVIKIDAQVLLDEGDAGLDLRFSVTFVDDGDTYSGYAGADIAVRQSATA